uniref:Uncharacterized protein n=1 Tax=Solanum lycopersicum TaxID=4081 RepID=A0A3Q7EAH9_SOLLC
MDSSSDRIRLYKRLWGSIVLLLVVWLLLVSVLENRATKIMKKQRTNSIHSKMNLNFMSIKRRVPNGPDPIHNSATVLEPFTISLRVDIDLEWLFSLLKIHLGVDTSPITLARSHYSKVQYLAKRLTPLGVDCLAGRPRLIITLASWACEEASLSPPRPAAARFPHLF